MGASRCGDLQLVEVSSSGAIRVSSLTMVSLISLVLILLAAHVTRAALPCAVTMTNSTAASPGKGIGCAFAWFDVLSDRQCRQGTFHLALAQSLMPLL